MDLPFCFFVVFLLYEGNEAVSRTTRVSFCTSHKFFPDRFAFFAEMQENARMKNYLTRLNPPQREAVETTDGALLILAGAGTGKTRVLTTRLAHILALGLAR